MNIEIVSYLATRRANPTLPIRIRVHEDTDAARRDTVAAWALSVAGVSILDHRAVAGAQLQAHSALPVAETLTAAVAALAANGWSVPIGSARSHARDRGGRYATVLQRAGSGLIHPNQPALDAERAYYAIAFPSWLRVIERALILLGSDYEAEFVREFDTAIAAFLASDEVQIVIASKPIE